MDIWTLALYGLGAYLLLLRRPEVGATALPTEQPVLRALPIGQPVLVPEGEPPEPIAAVPTVPREGTGFFIGGPVVRGVIQLAGAATGNPLWAGVSRFIASLIPTAPPAAPAPIAAPAQIAPMIGALEVPPSYRQWLLPTGAGVYKPTSEEVGYQTGGLQVQVDPVTGQGTGTVQTAQGLKEFTFDVPFPEAGF